VALRKIDRLFNYTYSTAPTPSLGSKRVPLVKKMCGYSILTATNFIVSSLSHPYVYTNHQFDFL